MKSIVPASWLAFLLLLLAVADVALADESFILATGRRDPRIYAIDFNAALKPRNNNTPNAIVSRAKVHPDRLDGTPVGDPANIVLSEDHRTAYVVNHHGPVNNAEFLQHGGRGSVSVMDLSRMLRPEFDNTDRAVERNYDSGYFGAVGLVVLPELLLVSHSENWLTEDGSNRISIIDRKTGGRRAQIEMALGHPGHACPDFPVPFVSPTPPPTVPFATPDPLFGCWPNPEFLALGHGSDGKTYLFSGNAGTDDVSVMDLHQALMGAPVVEIAPRIPVQTGPFGIKASPNGKFIAVTARESGQADFEGNTIHIDDGDRIPLEIRLPALPRGDGDELTVWARFNAEGAGLNGNAGRDFDDRRAHQRLVEVHHGHIGCARVAREEISLAVTAMAQGQELRIRPATESRVRCLERNSRGRSRGDKGNRKIRAGVSRMAERHLDLCAAAAGLPVDDADAIRPVLGQPVFRVAHEEQVRKDHESDGAEVSAVVISLDRAIGIVEFRPEHPAHVHDRDAAAASMLEELGIVHRPVMIDHVRRPMIVAEHDVGGIADRRAVQTVRVNLGPAHDGVRRVVVPRFQRRAEVDGVDPRVSAPGGKDE